MHLSFTTQKPRYPPIYPSNSPLSILLLICSSIHPSNHPSIHPFIHSPLIPLFILSSIYPPSIHVPSHPSSHPSIHSSPILSSICQAIPPSLHLPLHLLQSFCCIQSSWAISVDQPSALTPSSLAFLFVCLFSPFFLPPFLNLFLFLTEEMNWSHSQK